MKQILSILCLTLCLFCFPFSAWAINDTYNSTDNSSNIVVDIGGEVEITYTRQFVD